MCLSALSSFNSTKTEPVGAVTIVHAERHCTHPRKAQNHQTFTSHQQTRFVNEHLRNLQAHE